MTTHPRHAFDVVPGQPQPSLATLIFRRLTPPWWRRPAVPEASFPASGAALPDDTATFAAIHPAAHHGYAPVLPRADGEVINADHFVSVHPAPRHAVTVPRRQPGGFPPGTTGQPVQTRHAVYGEAPQLDVQAAEQARSDAARAWYQDDDADLNMLRIVRDRLREVL